MPNLTLEQITVIVAIVLGTPTAILAVIKIYKEIHKPPPEFTLQRFKEPREKPVKSDWGIRILYPNEPIEKCRVLYDEVPLPWWDKDEPYYESFIHKGSGGIVTIPVELENEDAKIKIMDGQKVLRRRKLKDIPITHK